MSTNTVAEGGLVSTSFPSTRDKKDLKMIASYFLADSHTSATQAANRSLNVGH